jgi:hypothetical protein
MRLAALLVPFLLAAPAMAQQVGVIGPKLKPGDVRAERFDVVFTETVSSLPTTPVFWNQSPDARWDVVVCNTTAGVTGAVKAEPTARWGHLEADICTMFANVAKLDLSAVEGDKTWTARIFLRAAF